MSSKFNGRIPRLANIPVQIEMQARSNPTFEEGASLLRHMLPNLVVAVDTLRRSGGVPEFAIIATTPDGQNQLICRFGADVFLANLNAVLEGIGGGEAVLDGEKRRIIVP